MPALDLVALRTASAAYPKPPEFRPSYGTAGFRAEASLLPSTVFRCGLLVGLRALSTGQACGVMITASHNPAPDNGVKLVDPSGEMLDQAWEAAATALAQAASDEQLVELFAQLVVEHPPAAGAGRGARTNCSSSSSAPRVLIGRDTRPSGEVLSAAAAAGVVAAGAAPQHIGVVTTPELHSAVIAANAYGGHCSSSSTSAAAAAQQEADYFTCLLESFRSLAAWPQHTSFSAHQQQQQQPPLPQPQPQPQPLHVDCANGVGGLKLAALAPQLQQLGLALVLYNTGQGQLNAGCGADFVQKEQAAPAGMRDLPPGSCCASIDGDADRVVFFTTRPDGSFVLLDGDKIAALAAVYLRQLLAQAPPGTSDGVVMGVVQTAYANGGSTAFLTQALGLPVLCTNTGVKYLHHEAKRFDIGIYFEANGHGTVLFKPQLLQRLQDMDEQVAVLQLLAVSRLMNQAVGDALSGLLLCEAVMRSGTSLEQWQALYTDLPSRQLKLQVADRGAITTTDAERRCVTPPGLQAAIDAAVAKYPCGRAFARPSGTEDAVRVYAEAGSQVDADALAADVARAVHDLAGGVGPRP